MSGHLSAVGLSVQPRPARPLFLNRGIGHGARLLLAVMAPEISTKFRGSRPHRLVYHPRIVSHAHDTKAWTTREREYSCRREFEVM